MKISEYPVVYIVLLHWKDYDDTKACLKSFKKVSYPNYKVIVVDNHSDDGSVERLRGEFTDVIYVLNKSNLGFSCGCNAGLREAYRLGADYILLLNNDMEVEPGFLEPAIVAAEGNPGIGAVTGKIMYKDRPNIFWQAGGYIHAFRVQGMARGMGQEDRGQYDKICETGWASGAMSLFPRATIEKVGYLPEEYFFGQEEWDYSTAILRAGLKILYVPEFKAYHQSGGSYKPGHPILNIYGGYLNKMIYAQKYMPSWLWRIWRISFYAYIKLRWPSVARTRFQKEEDCQLYIRAANMAFEDHKRIKKVGLAELKDAARRLGSTPTWGDSWQSDQALETPMEKAL